MANVRFNLQLRNQITEAIQLLKPSKFGLLGGLPFMRIKNIQI